ncbi:dTDP-4-dehydrorhamnose reductase [Peribacillus cavernae]|uniref:dTDP-4-dehydrorhamnose reductase n=1 Tax=Peribacillus cavernae TaxID=1674310 RepID=A0A433HMC4_9BACI|nr:dTDP-4-dehydrorhamnose reductase [Peribacillus cavernae]MDQ0218896.1 dTDP-4-dehydrorhamnose reductase [Peribacillus cavernae]RUQ29383.1 dTDP-4-dehydrorhamnose reductase [Peribacillus cavernae]
MLSVKKILLLGANGQLGTDVQDVFSPFKQYEIINVYRNQLDVEKDNITDFLTSVGDFDILINCTSYHKTDECEDFPAKSFAINSLAVWEIAKFCNAHNKVLFHITTDYIFDGKSRQPYLEDDCPNPLNVYGTSKLSGEHFIKAYHDKYFIFRVSSLFGKAGASGKGGNFVETMINLGNQGKTIRVIDDQVMSPTHTLDIAKAIHTFIDQDVDSYGVYHCSGEGECSWHGFAEEIFTQLNMDVDLIPVPHTSYQTKANRPLFSVLDNSKLNELHQMPNWRDSLTAYLIQKGYLS